MQLNGRRFQAHQLLVNSWSKVQAVVDQILLKTLIQIYERNHPEREEDQEDQKQGLSKKGKANGSQGGQDLKGEEEDVAIDQESTPIETMQSDEMLDNVQFQIALIMQPTSFEWHKSSEGQYKKILHVNQKIRVDPMAVKLDFKDLELIIYLYHKTIQDHRQAFPKKEDDKKAENGTQSQKPNKQ
jgi:hypothetical protein